MALQEENDAIVVNQVSKTYVSDDIYKPIKTRALRDVSLVLHRGEILGLVGPNGAGKTTLIRSILNLIRIDSGSIVIDGASHSTENWKASVGYLPEDFRAEEHASARTILTLIARLRHMTRRDAARRIDEVLQMMELHQCQKKAVGTFSKGMLLRVGLAQAILHHPSILILDEPTNGLDPVGKKMIFDLLESFRKEGCAILLSSHQLSEVERLADRVAILQQGVLKMLIMNDGNGTAGSLEDQFFKHLEDNRS